MTSQDLYTAWRVHEKNGGYEGAEERCSISDLPENDVLIRVTHSSLNYKDALSASGNKGVTRNFPHPSHRTQGSGGCIKGVFKGRIRRKNRSGSQPLMAP